mgnify:CR=1 FL=1
MRTPLFACRSLKFYRCIFRTSDISTTSGVFAAESSKSFSKEFEDSDCKDWIELLELFSASSTMMVMLFADATVCLRVTLFFFKYLEGSVNSSPISLTDFSLSAFLGGLLTGAAS